jgi:hypothetical protein
MSHFPINLPSAPFAVVAIYPGQSPGDLINACAQAGYHKIDLYPRIIILPAPTTPFSADERAPTTPFPANVPAPMTPFPADVPAPMTPFPVPFLGGGGGGGDRARAQRELQIYEQEQRLEARERDVELRKLVLQAAAATTRASLLRKMRRRRAAAEGRLRKEEEEREKCLKIERVRAEAQVRSRELFHSILTQSAAVERRNNERYGQVALVVGIPEKSTELDEGASVDDGSLSMPLLAIAEAVQPVLVPADESLPPEVVEAMEEVPEVVTVVDVRDLAVLPVPLKDIKTGNHKNKFDKSFFRSAR